MTVIYRIVKWADTFEKSDSKRYKSLTWVSWPVGFDSNGYHELLSTFGDEAPAIYGAWAALVMVAAKAPERGTLASSKGGYSLARLASDTRFPAALLEKLIAWASSKAVGWLEIVDDSTDTRLSTDSEPEDAQHPPDGETTPAQQPTGCDPVGTRATQHYLTQPNITRPNEPSVSGRDGGRSVEAKNEKRIVLDTKLIAELTPLMARIARVVTGNPAARLDALTTRNRRQAAQAAAVAKWRFGPEWLDAILASIAQRTKPPDSRWGHFRGALIKAAKRIDRDYHDAEEAIEFAPELLAKKPRESIA